MWKVLQSTQRIALISLIGLSLSGLSACASLNEEIDHFQVAATSPLRDANLLQQSIPQQLQYLSHPYGRAGMSGCQAWTSEIEQLEQAIIANDGRRPGYRRDSNTFVGRTGNLRDAGVRALSRSVLPFRGVVRQVSGAARLEQNANRASDRARYRIGYLVGLARANRCPGFGEGQRAPVQRVQSNPLSPAVVRQSYPTLSSRQAQTPIRYVRPYPAHQPRNRTATPPPYPQTYYQTYPQGYTQPPAQPQIRPERAYPVRVSRGPQRSSRR